MIEECCRRLERYRLLASPAWIYLETEHRRPPPVLPDHWRTLHDKTSGQVGYRLVRRDAVK